MSAAIPLGLIAAFFITALLYASVGFGGGSTYAALLALSGLDYRLLPVLALACNIVVVAGSTIRFSRAKLVPWRRALLLTGIAAPAAFLGGLTPIGEQLFLCILGLSLLLTGGAMLLPVAAETVDTPHRMGKYVPVAAALVGYLAGLVGIGGGIFLAPLLHLVRWDGARTIAATASVFILINSSFGMIGQLLKSGTGVLGGAIGGGLALLLAVAIGGQIGSFMAVKWLPKRILRWFTATLVIAVGLRLLVGL